MLLPRPARLLVWVALCSQLLLLLHFMFGARVERKVRRFFVTRLGYSAGCCAVDALGGSAVRSGGGGGNTDALGGGAGERFLIYQPQFGFSNQLIALRSAAGWATALNRTLVLPHLLGHATEKEYQGGAKPRRAMAEFGDAFDYGVALRGVAPLRVVSMDSFLKLRLPPAQLVELESVRLAHVSVRDDYFDALAVIGAPVVTSAPPLGVPLTVFLPRTIIKAFGGCHATHRVLAIRSLFNAWDPKPGTLFTDWTLWSAGRGTNGYQFLDRVVMPALLRPSPPVRRVVRAIVRSVTSIASPLEAEGAAARRVPLRGAEGAAAGGVPPVGRSGGPIRRPKGGFGTYPPRATLACVHVRRGDFETDCPRYMAEAQSPTGRKWVKTHFERGHSCLQQPADIDLNLRALQATHHAAVAAEARRQQAAQGVPPDERPLSIFASVEDPAWISDPLLRRWNISHFGLHAARSGASELRLPRELATPMLDQLVCSHARYFVLNVFSTFSQAVMAHVGLANGAAVGWVRDLTPRQQRRIGIAVSYWRQAARVFETQGEKDA